MATYIFLSCFSPDAFREPAEIKRLAASVSERIKRECPGVEWKSSFATTGPFDVVDIVEAEDIGQVEKTAMIIRSHGHSSTETLFGVPWKDFLGMF